MTFHSVSVEFETDHDGNIVFIEGVGVGALPISLLDKLARRVLEDELDKVMMK